RGGASLGGVVEAPFDPRVPFVTRLPEAPSIVEVDAKAFETSPLTLVPAIEFEQLEPQPGPVFVQVENPPSHPRPIFLVGEIVANADGSRSTEQLLVQVEGKLPRCAFCDGDSMCEECEEPPCPACTARGECFDRCPNAGNPRPYVGPNEIEKLEREFKER